MHRTDNGTAPPAARAYRLPEDGPLPDLPLYERLISDGITAADGRGTSVDHVTARRLAIWLAARPQAPVFAQGLVRFAETGTITLVLDTATASIAMFALAAHADEREAHVREVERFGQTLPDGSYGRRNRRAIAVRETRIATRLRAVQHAYQAVAGHDTAYTPPEPTRTFQAPGLQASRQIELEAEP